MASHTYTKAAHSKAITKYTKEKRDRIEIRVPKELGFKDKVTAFAKSKDMSVNAFIIEAINKAMDEETQSSK